ncbi:MAG: sigma-70 family RNA polymerase sigma factor [Myxococcales bacterium]|nr:sigma-70 family RNA polymerase sigma factor [Myxococcales bacterium]
MEFARARPLSERFAVFVAGDSLGEPAQAAALETRLADVLQKGRAAWPELALALSDDEFLQYLGERLPEGAVRAGTLDGIHAADLYLAAACTLGRPHALAAFERYCFVTLPLILARFSTQPDFHDEVRQALRERLFVRPPDQRARIADYAGRGSLCGWVRVIAVRLAVDLLRQQGKAPPLQSDDVLQTLATDGDTELRILSERYREEVKVAFHDAFAALSPAERNLLRLHHIDGLTIDDLAALKRLHRSTMARRITRCSERVATTVHQLLVQRLGITPSHVDSIMRLVRSQLDLSLERCLQPTRAPRR